MDSTWGVTMLAEEWKKIEYWHVDPASGRSTQTSFYDWDLWAPTSDAEKGCDGVDEWGYTTCWIYTPAGVNAGWIGGENGEGLRWGPDLWFLD